ncbi:GNAT family N-acetyltransferase [Pseudomonas cremoricolorata]|uniref:GNAT family N-acetyltransferase n=1 Tax=Pseudomonas cremoricolorata TaxID=157783 RepID=UPI00040D66BD|nr:GNAT family N-acetyltransferase [Pseudomonas cremoricolorata]
MTAAPAPHLQYDIARAQDAPAIVELIRSIAPAALEQIYGAHRLRGYLLDALLRDQGHFGLSRHRVLRLEGRCIAVIAGYRSADKLRLDLATLVSIVRHYNPVRGLAVIRRLVESVQHCEKPGKGAYFIYNFAIAEAFRSQGLGTALFLREMQQAARSGCNAMQLDVDAGNAGAVKFYERLGLTARSCSPARASFTHAPMLRMTGECRSSELDRHPSLRPSCERADNLPLSP